MLRKRKHDLEQALPNKQSHNFSTQTPPNLLEIGNLVPIPDYALQNFWSDSQGHGNKLASFMVENSGSIEKELSELKAENAFLKETMQFQAAAPAITPSAQMELRVKDTQIAELRQIINNQAYQLKLYREKMAELQRQKEILQKTLIEQCFEYGPQPRIVPPPPLPPLPSRNFNFNIWHPLGTQSVPAAYQAACPPDASPVFRRRR